jgi:hypothetical protein
MLANDMSKRGTEDITKGREDLQKRIVGHNLRDPSERAISKIISV